MAKWVLQANGARLHVVAALLIEKRQVTGVQLEAVLGVRAWMHLRALFRPGFVLPDVGHQSGSRDGRRSGKEAA